MTINSNVIFQARATERLVGPATANAITCGEFSRASLRGTETATYIDLMRGSQLWMPELRAVHTVRLDTLTRFEVANATISGNLWASAGAEMAATRRLAVEGEVYLRHDAHLDVRNFTGKIFKEVASLFSSVVYHCEATGEFVLPGVCRGTREELREFYAHASTSEARWILAVI